MRRLALLEYARRMRWMLGTLFVVVCALTACGAEEEPTTSARDKGDPGEEAPDAGPSPEAQADAAPGDAGVGGSPTSCESADERGFFDQCPSCATGQCFSFSQKAVPRSACRCAQDADCPCGLRCGCFEPAPGIPICNVCLRDREADAGQGGTP